MEGKEAAQSFFEGRDCRCTRISISSPGRLWTATAINSRFTGLTFFREMSHESAYPRLLVASSLEEAKVAIAAAEELPQVKLFRWRAFAVAINATSKENGSWDIEYYDPLVKMQMDDPKSFIRPTSRSYGSVRVAVEDGVARVENG